MKSLYLLKTGFARFLTMMFDLMDISGKIVTIRFKKVQKKLPQS